MIRYNLRASKSPSNAWTISPYVVGGVLFGIVTAYIVAPALFPKKPRRQIQNARGPVRLYNPGNDCFVNCVLQALTKFRALHQYLDDVISVSTSKCQSSSAAPTSTIGPYPRTTVALRAILRSLNDDVQEGVHTISARQFILEFEQVIGRRMNRRQQDAQEFLQLLAEQLIEERGALDKFLSQSNDAERKNEIIGFPFKGHMTTEIECRMCGHKPAASIASFVNLTLNIPHGTPSTLDTCLDGLLKKEVVDDYRCNGCGVRPNESPQSRGGISRFVRISTYPPVLVIHLSRSNYWQGGTSQKNNAFVSFPELLAIGALEERLAYRLSGIIIHHGSHDSGHYETVRRQNTQFTDEVPMNAVGITGRPRTTNRWWRISDNIVAECTTKGVFGLGKEVYLLFYERIG